MNEHPRSTRFHQWFAPAISMVWMTACLAGFVMLWRYAAAPGAQNATQTSWPDDTQLACSRDMATLVMFAHPRCPCTRASVAELERILTVCPNRAQATIVFYVPNGSDPEWGDTDLSRRVARSKQMKGMQDVDGVEARRFGATTSGQVLLYDRQGRLLYNGGITASRGHQGSNLGRSTVVELLTNPSTPARRLPVFGCPIHPGPLTQAAAL